jgi:hypothetical protein
MDSVANERRRKRAREYKAAYRRAKNGPGLSVKKIRAHDGLRIRKNNSSKATKNAERKSPTLEQAIVGN